jgi:hypothetical protein
MKKWVEALMMILIGAGLWLLYNYIIGTLEPIALNVVLALVFGVCMWGIELFFHRKNKTK